MANWRRPCSSRHRDPTDTRPPQAALAAALLASFTAACGHAGNESLPPAPDGPALPSAQQALCIPANEGSLRAKLQGAIDAEFEWGAGVPHCRGGLRPGGDGVRLIYKGELPGEGPVLIVIGAGPLAAGQSARDVPVNLTIVREGTGRFFATQGDDKCAFDEVRQEPTDDPRVYRLTGRGYCTQPARAVVGEGSVLLPRFDVTALVDFR